MVATVSGLRMPPGLQEYPLREAGINTGQSNLNPMVGFSVCVAPEWLKSGFMQVPEHFWRAFCKGMRNYRA